MMKRTLAGLSVLCLGAATLFTSCSSNSNKSTANSDKTGWDYNDPKLGGFDVTKYPGQQTGPGLTMIEGGRFTMGQTEEDLLMERNSIPRTVSVSSFYMDETEVANIHYREYYYWMQRAYGSDYPGLVAKARPDSTVWRKALSYNEPMVEYYFRMAAYNYYPVVGVNWYQANEYAKWRSDRVNEYILMKRGALKKNPNQTNEDIYTTEAYINGQYEGLTNPSGRKRDLDPNGSGRRNYDYSDGLLLPNYRLPTEAEWEYAALGLIGNNPEPENKRRRGEEVITDRNIYPWGPKEGSRYGLRNSYQGEFLGNFKRGRGDVMGVAGGLNDNADRTAPIFSYRPNAFGLYNMAGNVSEWVLDTYRPVTRDQEDFAPFRGNVYDGYRRLAEDNSLEERDSLGNIPRRLLDSAELARNPYNPVRTADLRDYSDGDSSTTFDYDYGRNTLISNDAKVIKGGSWNDRAYRMSPANRRFMQADQSSSTVGFRCVMDRLGSPNGNNAQQPGNYFGNSRRK